MPVSYRIDPAARLVKLELSGAVEALERWVVPSGVQLRAFRNVAEAETWLRPAARK